jgi:transcriptional regulator NrdR family protein
MHHIVKRKGHKEAFDERKVYGSCYASLVNSHRKKEDAERACEKVCNDVKEWISVKPEVDSNELFNKITEAIASIDKDAAFMYETHRDLS